MCGQHVFEGEQQVAQAVDLAAGVAQEVALERDAIPLHEVDQFMVRDLP